jgi:GAF domain-containing protein
MTSNGGTAAADASMPIAELFVTLADTLVDDYDVHDLMSHLVSSCVELFNTIAAALLLLDQRGGLQVIAASGESAQTLEALQVQTAAGPCLDCVATGRAVIVADLDHERARWPAFVEAALSLGFSSATAVPLRLRAQTIGALGLFGDQRRQLSAHEQRLAQALADVATIGILQQRSLHRSGVLSEQLQTALDSRITIEQAKGVLAQLGGVEMDVAYRALRRYARDHNLKLTALATAVVHDEVDRAAVLSSGS